MNEKKFKKLVHDTAFDIAVAVGAFYNDQSTEVNDLSEARSSAESLIRNIDDYLNSKKPKFEVGDYITNVTSDNERTFIGVVSVINLDMHDGLFYHREKNELLRIIVRTELGTVRHATPEEIAEYKAALNFHEHGRKPFEVEAGDLLIHKNKKIFAADNHVFSRFHFTEDKYIFVKTAEEVEKWLADGQ